MEKAETFNHNLSTVGTSLILIWWGIVIIVPPFTLGMGAIGTGLLLLAVNLIRRLRGIPTKESTTTLGVIALIWGILYSVFDPGFAISFALLLIVVGLVSISSLWSLARAES